jgi:hypothetical protein
MNGVRIGIKKTGNENGLSKEKHFVRTSKTNFRRSEPAISVPWGIKIQSNSRSFE